MSKHVRTLLENADPARGVVIGAGDADAVLRRAATDITSYEAVPRLRSTRRVVLVAAVAVTALAGAAALAWPGSRSDPGPVPGPPAVQGSSGPTPNCLSALADHLAPAPYDGAAGRYQYLHTHATAGTTTQVVGRTDTFATATWPVETRLWFAADGSGRQISERGPVQYQDEASRAFFAAHPDFVTAEHQDVTFPAGERPPHPLPAAEPAAMAEQLYQPRENGPSAALVGVAELNAGRILDAAHRAAVLRFLATVDGVTCGGETQTDVGAGLLVTAPIGQGPHPSPGDNGSEALLFDTRTGELMAAGAGPGRWSTVYLDRGYTDQTG